MTQRFSRLDPADVLDSLRTDIVPSSAAAKERVSTRLSTSIAMLPRASERLTDETDEAAQVGEAPAEPLETPQLMDRGGSLASAHVGNYAPHASHWLGAWTRRPLAWSLATFSVGAACGAGLHAVVVGQLNRPAVFAAQRDPQPIVAPSPPGAPPQTDPQARAALSPTSDAPGGDDLRRETAASEPLPMATASGRGRMSGNRMTSLTAQQALLDEARTALARGDEKAALRAIDLHARRYPDSVMTEEREALAIKALIASGNYAEARARSGRFRARYPRSLLLPSIDEALSEIP